MTGGSRVPSPAPPWHQVIATTLQLWWQRHGIRPAAPIQPRSGRVLRIAVSLLVIALVAVSATAIHLAQTQASESARSAPVAQHAASIMPVAADTAAIKAAAASRQLAAAWVAAQVGQDVIVACDPLMCTTLQQHGIPAANLTPVGPGSGDPLGSGIVVSTAALRATLGPRLTSVYAPVVVASFGGGQSLVQVLATAPDGAAAYRAAELADTRARVRAGRQLLRNKDVHLSAIASRQLAAGQVDSRLLITLAALARHPVRISSFGDSGPGAAGGVPLRAMTIRSTGGRDLRRLLSFLRAQRAPLLALTAVSHAGKATFLHVEFTAPSPTGLLTKT